jgi:hypothetical protein
MPPTPSSIFHALAVCNSERFFACDSITNQGKRIKILLEEGFAVFEYS